MNNDEEDQGLPPSKEESIKDESSSSSSELGDLEEDDLELIEHNLRGQRDSSSTFRRLVKKQNDDSAIEENAEDDDEDEEESFPKIQRKRRAEDLAKLFEDDDESDHARSPHEEEEEEAEDDLADFIEEDEDEELIPRQPSKAKSMPQGRREQNLPRPDFDGVFGQGLSRDMLQDLLDIFGDGSEYAGMLAEEDEGEEKEEVDLHETPMQKGNVSGTREFFEIPERLLERSSEGRPSDEELNAEASWIAKRFVQSMNFQEKQLEALQNSILAVLRFMRLDLLEVPFIATHRKEYFHDLLSLNDLWRIWDDHEHWRLFKRQRVALEKRLASSESLMALPDSPQSLIERADTLELQQVCLEYLQKVLGSSGRAGPKGGSDTSVPLPTGVLTPSQFAENWATGQTIHRHSFDGSVDVSAAAVHLGLHPSSHSIIRGVLMSRATISTHPTAKGLEEVTNSTDDILAHELLPFRQIRAKPVSAWIEDHWSIVKEGEAMGLIEVSIGFGDFLTDFVGGSLGRAFGCVASEGKSTTNIPTKILSEAVSVHNLPRLKRQILLDLAVNAEHWIAQQAQFSLQDRLMTAPGEALNNETGEIGKKGPLVLALSMENVCTSGTTPILHGAVVDAHGRLIEQGRWPITVSGSPHSHHFSVVFPAQEELVALCKDLQVTTVVVAGQHPAHKTLYEQLGRIINENSTETTQINGKSKKKKSRQTEINPKLSIIYGFDDTARMLLASSVDSSGSSSINRYCQSVARRWLNPLGELCAIITQGESVLIPTGLHPHQSLAPRDLMARHVERALINVINLVGVDVNEATASSSKGGTFNWGKAILPWVCGLGSAALEALVQARKKRSKPFESREAIQSVFPPSSAVYINCASFLRITQASLGSNNNMISRYNPLDDSRIHPSNYQIACKMACDALEVPTHEPADDLAILRRIMQEEPSRLDDLNLEAYAIELERQLGPPKRLLTLLDIRSELQHPYIDLRLSVTPSESATIPPKMSPDAVFAMLTGESERSLWLGQHVSVKVLGLSDRAAQCQLLGGGSVAASNGGVGGGRKVAAVIPLRNMRSLGESGRQPLHPGQALRAGQVAKAVVTDIRLEDLVVELSMRPEDMVSSSNHAIPYDSYYDHNWRPQGSPIKKNAPATEQQVGKPRKRNISHPLYHSVSRQEAESMLASNNKIHGDSGKLEVVIRPSGSKGPDHLVLTWIVDLTSQIFQHVEIEEQDRLNEMALGRTLVMLGERYDDLDEIVARYVEPISSFLQDVRSCPKYLETAIGKAHGEGEARKTVEKVLGSQAAKQPGRICYGFWLSRDRPGHVVLSYLPGSSRVFHELVQVGPVGFQFRGRSFERLDALVNWFKLHYRDRK